MNKYGQNRKEAKKAAHLVTTAQISDATRAALLPLVKIRMASGCWSLEAAEMGAQIELLGTDKEAAHAEALAI